MVYYVFGCGAKNCARAPRFFSFEVLVYLLPSSVGLFILHLISVVSVAFIPHITSYMANNEHDSRAGGILFVFHLPCLSFVVLNVFRHLS